MKNKTQQLRQEIRYIIKEELEDFEQSSREVEYNTFPESNEPQEGEIMIDGKLVDINSIEMEGIGPENYPEFEDAEVVGAYFEDGSILNKKQLYKLNITYPEYINELAALYTAEFQNLDDDIVLEIEDEDIENLEDYTSKLDTALEKRKELKGNK